MLSWAFSHRRHPNSECLNQEIQEATSTAGHVEMLAIGFTVVPIYQPTLVRSEQNSATLRTMRMPEATASTVSESSRHSHERPVPRRYG